MNGFLVKNADLVTHSSGKAPQHLFLWEMLSSDHIYYFFHSLAHTQKQLAAAW